MFLFCSKGVLYKYISFELNAIYVKKHEISMKKLIFRNIYGDIASFFLITALSITLVVWVIQAVNFLDFVSEDGHSFKVYFMYSLLNLPKIFSRLIIFVFFISLFYIFSKYENNKEILIFWTNGIKKIEFINHLIKFSFLFLILQLVLNFLVVPKTQDLARSYIRDSNIDYLPSLIKSKQFIDTVSDLTIFVEKKEDNGILKNIFLKEYDRDKNESQIISAKSGIILRKNNKYSLLLFNGKVIDLKENKTTIFSFGKSEIDLSKYSTKSTTFPKIQELNSYELLQCINSIIKYRQSYTKTNYTCDLNSINEFLNETFKRMFSPIYILIIALITSCLIFKPNEEINYNKFRFAIFTLGTITLILSEVSPQLIKYSNVSSYLFLISPFIFSLFVYFFLIIKFKFNFKKNYDY